MNSPNNVVVPTAGLRYSSHACCNCLSVYKRNDNWHDCIWMCVDGQTSYNDGVCDSRQDDRATPIYITRVVATVFDRHVYKHASRPASIFTVPTAEFISTHFTRRSCAACVNFLTGNATSNNMKLAHWPLMGGCYIWYSDEGTERSRCTNHRIAV